MIILIDFFVSLFRIIIFLFIKNNNFVNNYIFFRFLYAVFIYW